MHEVAPRLYVGDYGDSQNLDTLRQAKITHVVAASELESGHGVRKADTQRGVRQRTVRQEYELPGDEFTLLRVPVDDDERTNILATFDATSDFIKQALDDGGAVLVHCQAGVSRSPTLVAAHLLRTGAAQSAAEAIETVRKGRAAAQPSDTFVSQLEMYARCANEWDPVKWTEQRRFLMGFMAAQVRGERRHGHSSRLRTLNVNAPDGSSNPSLVLAYYPSPTPSPKDRRESFKLTPISPTTALPESRTESRSPPRSPAATATSEPDKGPEAHPVLRRKRLTPRSRESEERLTRAGSSSEEQQKRPVEKIGTKSQVKISGKRLRCKMCRRELAAREHVLEHEPGVGQQAFAPRRRDPRSAGAPRPPPTPSSGVGGAASALAGLRVSVPPSARERSAPAPVADPRAQRGADESSPRALYTEDTKSNEPREEDKEATVEEEDDEAPLLPSEACSSYFVEPLSWMSAMLDAGQFTGKILCPSPRCGAKLGSFDWAGLQCSCGAWVCPGFALNTAKVDEVDP